MKISGLGETGATGRSDEAAGSRRRRRARRSRWHRVNQHAQARAGSECRGDVPLHARAQQGRPSGRHGRCRDQRDTAKCRWSRLEDIAAPGRAQRAQGDAASRVGTPHSRNPHRARLAALGYVNTVIGILREGGFTIAQAHHALHIFGSRLLGFTQALFDDSGTSIRRRPPSSRASSAPPIPMPWKWPSQSPIVAPSDHAMTTPSSPSRSTSSWTASAGSKAADHPRTARRRGSHAPEAHAKRCGWALLTSTSMVPRRSNSCPRPVHGPLSIGGMPACPAEEGVPGGRYSVARGCYQVR